MRQIETKTRILLPVMAVLAMIFILANGPIRYVLAPDQIVLYNNGNSITLNKDHKDYTYVLGETRKVLLKNSLNILGRTKSAVDNIKGHEGIAEELIYNPPGLLTGYGNFISFGGRNAEMFISGDAAREYRPGGIRLESTSKLLTYITENAK